jgi:rare lipoprotein A (peptidoglycan hydrolase)
MWGWVRMNLRITYGVAVAALALTSGAIPTRSFAAELPLLTPPPAEAPDVTAPIQVAPGTREVAQIASATMIVRPLLAEIAPPAPAPVPKPPVPSKEAKHRTGSEKPINLARNAPAASRVHIASAGDGDLKLLKVKAIGPCQLGSAAWYGGRYVGRRTSSGEPLDQTHATAAHRTLPLNSLVRVTNLNNGRSVVVRITDRGPVSERLLIDVSPKAADELAMKTAGIVPVSIEQVVEVPPNSK